MNVPVVILKKQVSKNLGTEVWQTEVSSYTKDISYELTLAKNYISDTDHILIIDDFLANGRSGASYPQGPCHHSGRRRPHRKSLPARTDKAGEPGDHRIRPGKYSGL